MQTKAIIYSHNQRLPVLLYKKIILRHHISLAWMQHGKPWILWNIYHEIFLWSYEVLWYIIKLASFNLCPSVLCLFIISTSVCAIISNHNMPNDCIHSTLRIDGWHNYSQFKFLICNAHNFYVTIFWKISPNVTFYNSNIYNQNEERQLPIN